MTDAAEQSLVSETETTEQQSTSTAETAEDVGSDNIAVAGEQLIDAESGVSKADGGSVLNESSDEVKSSDDHPVLSVFGEIEAELAAIPEEFSAAISALVAKAKALF